ncbi:hypothetical protein ACFL2V_09325 [Pseudomonadota bacterium]
MKENPSEIPEGEQGNLDEVSEIIHVIKHSHPILDGEIPLFKLVTVSGPEGNRYQVVPCMPDVAEMDRPEERIYDHHLIATQSTRAWMLVHRDRINRNLKKKLIADCVKRNHDLEVFISLVDRAKKGDSNAVNELLEIYKERGFQIRKGNEKQPAFIIINIGVLTVWRVAELLIDDECRKLHGQKALIVST